jgi:hypothetical protein
MSHSVLLQSEIINHYRHNIQVQESSILKLKRHKTILSMARLIIAGTGMGVCWYFWPSFYIVFTALVAFSAIFIFLVFQDSDKTAAIRKLEFLRLVNKHETDAMLHELDGYDDGNSFSDPAHAYSQDLDLFGTGSLFQWMNRCHAEQSKKLLADYLKTAPDFSTIENKQTAALELSEKQIFCQNLQVAAMAKPLTLQTEENLRKSMDAPPEGFQNRFWKWFQNIYPLIPSSIVVFYILGEISDRAFLSCTTGFYFISVLISRKIGNALEVLLNIEPEIEGLQKQVALIEKESFKSKFLASLQNKLNPAGYKSASASLDEFVSILKKNDWRSNLLVNLILQIFLVWDLRLLLSLNEWKAKNKNQVGIWFHVIAEMEVVNSMASLVYNERDWSFPSVDNDYFHFSAEEIGHPLITEINRVTCNFSMEGRGKVALITGSNMAGKSTFLRSLGVNTVLALMGSPVCARKMSCCAVKLISSMRVTDNLAENTSTFYAELKKLQKIIESVNKQEKVFILLDEVLRGTNSMDRHKGSKALVRQLLQSGSVAVMATHDTELAHTESADPSVSNYHFEGKVVEGELFFDYKIKPGISESLNATTLMKKIGIHFQD